LFHNKILTFSPIKVNEIFCQIFLSFCIWFAGKEDVEELQMGSAENFLSFPEKINIIVSTARQNRYSGERSFTEYPQNGANQF
jgi:hypothetical protein